MTSMSPTSQHARLVIEAECNRCGPICAAENDALAIIRWAKAHTVATGHVVILNGTVDFPERENIAVPLARVARVSAQK